MKRPRNAHNRNLIGLLVRTSELDDEVKDVLPKGAMFNPALCVWDTLDRCLGLYEISRGGWQLDIGSTYSPLHDLFASDYGHQCCRIADAECS